MQFSFEPSAPLYVLLLCLPLAFFCHRRFYSQPADQPVTRDLKQDKPLKTIMQAPRDDLAPPKDNPFSLEELKQYNGSDPSKPIYVAIKGVFNSIPTFFI
jgi:membrane-associated progesterone receptor component